MTTFAETVEAIQGKTGTRGFGAKKRAAGEIIAKDIATEMGKLDPAVSGIASQILSDLSLETAAVSQATDPEELKAVSQRLQEYKGIINQTYKNLNDESKLSKQQVGDLKKLINTSQKNIKKAGRGLFGSANESFLDSLTDTLNPFTKIGEVIGQLPGGAPFEAYFNTLGDGLSDKIKGYFGIGGLTDDNVDKVEQYVSGKENIEETRTEYEENRPKTKADFAKDKTISNDESLVKVNHSLFTPPRGLAPRIGRTLGFALGLIDKSGKPFLLSIQESLEGKDPSATEGRNFLGDDKGIEIEGIAGTDGKDGKGGIMSFLTGLLTGALAGGLVAIGGGLSAIGIGAAFLANPMSLIGLAAFTLAAIGLGKALEIAAPAIKVFLDGLVDFAEVVGDTFIKAIKEVPDIMKGIEGIILSIGDSISGIVETIFESITTTIERLAKIDDGKLFEVAGGLTAVSGAVALFATATGIATAITALSSLFGGGPLSQLEKFDSEKVDAAADSIDNFSGRLKNVGDQIELFGKSSAPRILENFAEAMENFQDSVPGVVGLLKLNNYTDAFEDLTRVATDFVRDMTIIASPAMAVNVGTTQALAAASGDIQPGGMGTSVQTAIANDNKMTNITNHPSRKNPNNDMDPYYQYGSTGRQGGVYGL